MLDEHAEHRGMTMEHPVLSYAPIDRLVAGVRPLRLAGPVLIAPPTGAGAPWTAKSDAADRPLRTTLTLDGATGHILSREDFGGWPMIDRIVGYGVAAHEGQLFGPANQLLNLAVALGLMTLAVSGAVMWWRRKPEDVLGAPALRAWPPLAIGFVGLLVLLGVFLPMVGASMILVLLVENLILRRLPGPSRWLGLSPVCAVPSVGIDTCR
jgi:uncharacterized iron-regulated membrane protein